MSEEEIRMECLKLAVSLTGDEWNFDEISAKADVMFDYIMQINSDYQENKIEFEKINPDRSK